MNIKYNLLILFLTTSMNTLSDIALKKLEIETLKLSEKLNNKNFRNKAPEKIIEKFEADHEDLTTQLNKQKTLLESLEKINN